MQHTLLLVLLVRYTHIYAWRLDWLLLRLALDVTTDYRFADAHYMLQRLPAGAVRVRCTALQQSIPTDTSQVLCTGICMGKLQLPQIWIVRRRSSASELLLSHQNEKNKHVTLESASKINSHTSQTVDILLNISSHSITLVVSINWIARRTDKSVNYFLLCNVVEIWIWNFFIDLVRFR